MTIIDRTTNKIISNTAHKVITKTFLYPRVFGLFFLLLSSGPSLAQGAYTCTEVLGFSQSWEWYTGKSLSTARGEFNVEAGDFLPGWQGRFEFGSSVELWGSADFKGWEGSYRNTEVCSREGVDRVVFNISGSARAVEQWSEDISKVVTLINQKYEQVKQIVLLPVVGAKEGKCSNIRAVKNQPDIVNAISALSDESEMLTTMTAPKVSYCSHFSDGLGHLSADGSDYIHGLMMDYFE